jgi:intracellular sulfur oxidation DsrE/DsrF family protein
MFSSHTISPGAAIPEGYYDIDNIDFIQNRVAQILLQEFQQIVVITHADIIRVMQSALEQRRENVPKLNQRVIMELCNSFRAHQIDTNKHLTWEEGYVSSQRLVDYVGGISRFDYRGIKLKDQPIKYDGKSRVGGTQRFYFT